MSNFIHSREYLHDGDVVVVSCDHQCNVRVMSDGFLKLPPGWESSLMADFMTGYRPASRFQTMAIGT